MCIAVISDLCDDVVKYVRGGDTDITFGRLVFFFRRGIEFPSSWLLTRLALPTFDNSPRLPFKTDGTKLDQDSIQLETALQSQFSPPLSLRRPPPHCFPFYLFIFFFFSLLAYGSFLSLLSPILFCTRRDFQLGEKKKKRKYEEISYATSSLFFCGWAW
jgi:hypothetical protein